MNDETPMELMESANPVDPVDPRAPSEPDSGTSRFPLLHSRYVYGICCAIGGITGLQRLYIGDWKMWLGLTVLLRVFDRLFSSIRIGPYGTIMLTILFAIINIVLAVQVLIKSGFTADPNNQYLFIPQEEESSGAKTALIVVLAVIGLLTVAALATVNRPITPVYTQSL